MAFAIVLIICHLINLNTKLKIMDADNNANCFVLTTDKNFKNNETESSSALSPEEKELTIRISDNGFIDDGFDEIGLLANGGQNIKFIISNTGEKEHSFVVDELNIDSGLIAPKETKILHFEKIPNESKNYTFYSSVEDDAINGLFQGMIMILKK